jgi:hypothetical protein
VVYVQYFMLVHVFMHVGLSFFVVAGVLIFECHLPMGVVDCVVVEFQFHSLWVVAYRCVIVLWC